MADERKDRQAQGPSESSLWTTPADPTVHVEATPDPSVTGDDLRRAMEAARERAAAFEQRARRRQGLRELSQLTQEFGGDDREFDTAPDARVNGGTDDSYPSGQRRRDETGFAPADSCVWKRWGHGCEWGERNGRSESSGGGIAA